MRTHIITLLVLFILIFGCIQQPPVSPASSAEDVSAETDYPYPGTSDAQPDDADRIPSQNVTGEYCATDSECSLPIDPYVYSSYGPYEVRCIDNHCKVVVDLIESCDIDSNCDCSSYDPSLAVSEKYEECACISNRCTVIVEGIANGTLQMDDILENTTPAAPLKESWILEKGVRLDEGVSPFPIIVDGKIVLYYTGMGGIFRASSSDGINFGPGTEVIEQASNSAIIKLKDGGYRMIYNDMSTPPQPGERHPSSQYFLSAYSNDGLNWEKEAGVRFRSRGAPDYDTISVPCVVDIGNSTLRMYYVGDMYAPEYGRQGNNIRSALSYDDGLTWVREPGERISGDSMDPAILKIDDYYRMYYTVTDFETDMQRVYSAISTDGLEFEKEGVVLESETLGERFMDPEFIDFGRTTRMYVSLATGMGENEQTKIVSAVLGKQ